MSNYVVALAAVLVAAFARYLLGGVLGDRAPLLLFTLAVVVAGWVGGLKPGLLATAAGVITGNFLFVEPVGRLLPINAFDQVRVVLFVITGVAVSWLCETLHTARRRLIAATADERTWKARYEAAVESSGSVLYDHDYAARLATFGGSTEAMLGVPVAKMPKELDAFLELIHPDDRATFAAAAKAAEAESETFSMEYRLRRSDGEYVTVQDNGKVMRAANGHAGHVIGLLKDVTEQRRASSALHQTSQQLLLSLTVGSAAAFSWNIATDDVRILPNVIASFLGPADNLPTTFKAVLAQIHPDDRDAFERRVRQAIEQPGPDYTNEYRRVAPDGSVRWLSDVGRVEFGAGGKPLRLFGLATDITDRKQAEEKLRASEEFNRNLMDGSADCVKVMDTNGRVLHMNGPGLRLMEIDNFGPLCGLEWSALWPAEVRQNIMHALATAHEGGSHSFQAFCPTAKGTPRWWDVAVSPIRDGNGRVVRILSVSRDITARKQDEDRLRASEQRLRLGVDVAGLGIITIDYAADTATPDATAAALFGLEPGMAVPRSTVHARFHPDDRSEIADRMQQCIDPTGDGTFGMEHRVVLPNGSTRWLSVKKQVVFRKAGGACQPVSGVLAAVDVTARQQAEVQYRSIVEGNPALICRFCTDGRLAFVNDTFCRTFNRSRELLVGHRFSPLIPDEDRPAIAQLLQQLAPDMLPYTLEHRVVLPDGQTRWQRWTTKPVVDSAGEGTEYLAIGFDITDRKRAEERARLLSEAAVALLSTDEPDAMLRGLFAKIAPPFGLDVYFNYMADPHRADLQLASAAGITDDQRQAFGRIAYGQAVCGWVAAHRLPHHATDIQHSGDPKETEAKGMGLRACACHPLVSGGVLLGTLAFGSRSKDSFAAEELDFLHTICNYVAAAYERLRLVNQLRETDRKKDEFLATLAHELRNPLAPIRNGLQIMKLAGGDAGLVEKSRSMMERQVGQMAHLIDDLMDLSRISLGKFMLQKTRLKVAEAVQDAVDISRPLIKERGHELVVHVPSEPLYVDADRTRLAQVFGNLLNNAAKYTETGGRIRLTVERRSGDVVVTVEDNGVGIPAHMLNRVFDMFAQVDRALEKSQGGLGIGLNIVQKLVAMHDGSVSAASGGDDMGSTFTVRLPVVLAVVIGEKPDDPSAGSEEAKIAPRRRILVVDDNRDGATSLAEMLTMMGNDTQSAFDGWEAVAVAEAFKPDVVLMDIGMPRLNGYEACRRIRAKPWGLNIIIVAQTGWGQKDDKRKSQEAGFNFHMVKPIDPAALEQMLAGLETTTT